MGARNLITGFIFGTYLQCLDRHNLAFSRGKGNINFNLVTSTIVQETNLFNSIEVMF